MKNLRMILMLLVLLLLTMEQVHGFDCEQAKTSVHSCTSFLVGDDAEPSTTCCDGIKLIKSSVTTVDERRAACECIKNWASNIPNIKEDLAISLPKRCGVDIGFPITPNMNCNDIP
ncbi:non-specific lipid-transfer protein A-like [Vicia villosa]|uniref:non-specific lipid-transfer protein A-like n=1 Tax=Vicia villosa TaxID=3911 RepID=UPI00273C92E5|nr:non-specific lipid-transfer protein A-like [Vicia villosa]